MPSTTIPDEKTELLQSQKQGIHHNKDVIKSADNNIKRLCIIASVVVIASLIAVVAFFFRINDDDNNNNNNTQNHHEFPADFVWGAATSSYQVEGAVREGGRGTTIWDSYCHDEAHNILHNDTGDVACDHYHRYKEDVELMKELGLKAYRFSIAWSRIIPQPHQDVVEVNTAGIDFYNQLIDALLANDIEPWVTLYHWDLPQSLEDLGTGNGWLNDRADQTIEAFGEYARICYKHFGDRVKKWITVNEPWTVAIHGYNDGVKAPGRKIIAGGMNTESYIVGHHLLLAHGTAAAIYKQEFQSSQGGIIGLAANADYRYPKTNTREDTDAANRSILFMLGWFVDPILKGDYPTVMKQRLGDRLPRFTKEQKEQLLLGSCDFLGLNTYSSALAADPATASITSTINTTTSTLLAPGYWTDAYVHLSNDPGWEQNWMGWNIVPEGTKDLLLWITKRYGNEISIYITENGSSEEEPDHLGEEGTETLRDEQRRSFLEGNVRACAEAIEAGVPLKGYFAWSFMDNFEWEYGYQRRFGICHVDFDTQARTPKLSARWYGDTIQKNGNNIPRK